MNKGISDFIRTELIKSNLKAGDVLTQGKIRKIILQSPGGQKFLNSIEVNESRINQHATILNLFRAYLESEEKKGTLKKQSIYNKNRVHPDDARIRYQYELVVDAAQL